MSLFWKWRKWNECTEMAPTLHGIKSQLTLHEWPWKQQNNKSEQLLLSAKHETCPQRSWTIHGPSWIKNVHRTRPRLGFMDRSSEARKHSLTEQPRLWRRAEDWTDYSPRGSVGVGGEHASHQGYCINTPPGMCTGIHMRAQSDRLHGDLCNIMNKLGKVELWSQQTWRRLNGRALVNNSIGFNVL